MFRSDCCSGMLKGNEDMGNVWIDGVGEISLVRSQRARRITLTVRPTGLVRLTVPCGVSRARALAFAETKVAWIASARQRVAARPAAVPPLPPEAERERIEELRRAARVDLPPRVERIARMFGFSYGRITIRASRTKWGSCSFRNDLSLSLYLMALPERLRDYVIVHELCHTIHHDHSPRFHALVDRCLGGQERVLDRELKSYVIRR